MFPYNILDLTYAVKVGAVEMQPDFFHPISGEPAGCY